jgi:hypothetical protein
MVEDLIREVARRGASIEARCQEVFVKPSKIIDDRLRQELAAHHDEIVHIFEQVAAEQASARRALLGMADSLEYPDWVTDELRQCSVRWEYGEEEPKAT